MPWIAEDAPSIKRTIGGEIDSRFVVDVVDLCLDLGLFAPEKYAEYGVLTSRAIQRNYSVVLTRRHRKEVATEYWILPPDDSNGAIPVLLPELE